MKFTKVTSHVEVVIVAMLFFHDLSVSDWANANSLEKLGLNRSYPASNLFGTQSNNIVKNIYEMFCFTSYLPLVCVVLPYKAK